MVNRDFNQANALIKRLLEGTGGSADAYEEPLVAPGPVKEEPKIQLTMPPLPDLSKFFGKQEKQESLSDLPHHLPGFGEPLFGEPADTPVDEEAVDDEYCVNGLVDWKAVGDRVWTNPPPISDDYRSAGVVEDSAELLAIYKGFEKARKGGQPPMVTIETGTYQIEKLPGRSSWRLIDTVKDRLYVLENPSAHHEVVNEDDLFIWVMPESDGGVDLGYIHMGYVFLCK